MAQQAPMVNSATHDFAKNIPSSLVRRNNAISNEERRRTCVIGDDTQRSSAAFAFLQFFLALEIYAAEFGGSLKQRDKQIGVVVGDDALEDGGSAFQAHACVYAGFGKRRERAAWRRG